MVDGFPSLFRKTKLKNQFYFKQVGVWNQDIYLEFFKHTECWEGPTQKFVLKVL